MLTTSLWWRCWNLLSQLSKHGDNSPFCVDGMCLIGSQLLHPRPSERLVQLLTLHSTRNSRWCFELPQTALNPFNGCFSFLVALMSSSSDCFLVSRFVKTGPPIIGMLFRNGLLPRPSRGECRRSESGEVASCQQSHHIVSPEALIETMIICDSETKSTVTLLEVGGRTQAPATVLVLLWEECIYRDGAGGP